MRRLLALPVLMVFCMGVELPEKGPVPVEDPRPQSSLEKSAPVPEAKPVADATKPEPKADTPEKQATEPDEPASSEPETEKAEEPAPLPGITAPKADEAALVQCEAELRKLGTVFKREEPLHGESGCGIEAPYNIEQIVRDVALSPASQMRCETALELARWTDTVVVPAAEAMPDKITLTRINHGSTYVCRRRNSASAGKMSEHAIGNAVDVMSFEFKGHDPILVSPRAGDGTVEEAFQRAVRGGACLHFTTVLGPGTNASHSNHLHLDVIKRKRGYRLCE